MKGLFSIVTLLFSVTAIAQQKDKASMDVSMFPKSEKGFKQVVLHLPKKANEDDLKVELFVGWEQEVDCNRHFMSGSIEEKNLEGWGYTFYKVNSAGVVGSTKMACLNDKRTKAFVHMTPQIYRYNSRLPVVVYVPEKMEVRYKIWKAGVLTKI